MLPTREEAEKILQKSEQLNPGPWSNHCRVVAKCAEKIALQCNDMDAEKAFILGLMHDIGRRFGASHFGHIVNGYHYMMDLRYDEIARICLTHSFPIKEIKTYIGNLDVPDKDITEMNFRLDNIEYDDYDRLIQLCDCLAMPEGVVDMAKRIDDIARRYNGYPENKRKVNYELKKYFETKIGKNIYEVITDNSELWGL